MQNGEQKAAPERALCVCGEYPVNSFGTVCSSCQCDPTRHHRALLRKHVLPQITANVRLAGGWANVLRAETPDPEAA